MTTFLDSVYAGLSPEERSRLTQEQALNAYINIAHAHPGAAKGSQFNAADLDAMTSGQKTFAQILAEKRMTGREPGKGDMAAMGTQMAAGLGASYVGAGPVMLAPLAGTYIEKYGFKDSPRRETPFDIDQVLKDTSQFDKQIPGFSSLSKDDQAKIVAAAEMAGLGSLRGTMNLDGSDPEQYGAQFIKLKDPSIFNKLQEGNKGWFQSQPAGKGENLMSMKLDPGLNDAERERVEAFRRLVADTLMKSGQGGAQPPAGGGFTNTVMNATRPTAETMPGGAVGLRPNPITGQVEQQALTASRPTSQSIQQAAATQAAAAMPKPGIKAVRPTASTMPQGQPITAQRPVGSQMNSAEFDSQLEDALKSPLMQWSGNGRR